MKKKFKILSKNMSKDSNSKTDSNQKEPQKESEVKEVINDVDSEAGTNEVEVDEVKDENTELQSKIDSLQEQLDKEKKEYLFLMAEFDNFRKRTLKEKSELIKNGGEAAMKNILPIIDDFERAIEAINKSTDIKAVKEGIDLIYSKFAKYLEQNGVKPIETEGEYFDTELHEAITTFPAQDESMKGKIIDTVQKGYKLNDKVLRHSKVVVGQ